MTKKPFAIADYINPGDVSNLDRPADGEKIVQIPISEISENEMNFYDTSDVGELENSIALNGLLEPIIVFPHTEDNGKKYRIISGHRRFKAFSALAADDPEKYKAISAIVREPPKNKVVEELMLIEANRATRVLSSADTMRQAERYKDLLVQLKEQGVEIPGRLRDVVAEAMQISASRLARLEVIHKGLIPEYDAHFSDGSLNESTAYELARLAPANQHDILNHVEHIKIFTSVQISDVDRKMQMYFGPALKCEYNRDPRTQAPGYCDYGDEMWEISKKQNLWGWCPGCCATCFKRHDCEHVCPRAVDMVSAEIAGFQNKREATASKYAVRQDAVRCYVESFWEREKTAREAAGLDQSTAYAKIMELCRQYDFDPYFEDETEFCVQEGTEVQSEEYNVLDDEDPFEIDFLMIIARAYGCTTDYLIGVTNQPCSLSEPSGNWNSFATDQPNEGDCFIFSYYSFDRAENAIYDIGYWHNGNICFRVDGHFVPRRISSPIGKSRWIRCDDPEKINVK